jgi:hypothetical protein
LQGRARVGINSHRIGDFCDKRGLAMLDVAFAWLLAKPNINRE